jgi:hypothetical protein
LFRLGSTAVSLHHFFCFITYHATSSMSVNRRMLFSVVVLWNVSRLGSTLQLFPSVKMAYKKPCIYHVLYHAPRCICMMCTLFLKIECTLSLTLIFITYLTTCNTMREISRVKWSDFIIHLLWRICFVCIHIRKENHYCTFINHLIF